MNQGVLCEYVNVRVNVNVYVDVAQANFLLTGVVVGAVVAVGAGPSPVIDIRVRAERGVNFSR